jgi:hypothetical protein
MKRPVSRFYLPAAKGRLIGTRATHDGLNYIPEIYEELEYSAGGF